MYTHLRQVFGCTTKEVITEMYEDDFYDTTIQSQTENISLILQRDSRRREQLLDLSEEDER